jgi:hypothetical protein
MTQALPTDRSLPASWKTDRARVPDREALKKALFLAEWIDEVRTKDIEK